MVGAAVGGLLFENYLHIAFIIDGLTTLMSTLLIVLFVESVDVAEMKQEEINVYEENRQDDKNIWGILGRRKPLLVQLMVFLLVAFIYEQWSFTLPLFVANIYQAQGAKYFGLLASFNGAVVITFTPIFTWMLAKLTDAKRSLWGLLFGFQLRYFAPAHITRVTVPDDAGIHLWRNRQYVGFSTFYQSKDTCRIPGPV